jgi:hypothetical protein
MAGMGKDVGISLCLQVGGFQTLRFWLRYQKVRKWEKAHAEAS